MGQDPRMVMDFPLRGAEGAVGYLGVCGRTHAWSSPSHPHRMKHVHRIHRHLDRLPSNICRYTTTHTRHSEGISGLTHTHAVGDTLLSQPALMTRPHSRMMLVKTACPATGMASSNRLLPRICPEAASSCASTSRSCASLRPYLRAGGERGGARRRR